MSRTHRKLLVLNYVVSFQDHDDWTYMEWTQLKKYLTRPELIQLIRNVKAGKNYVSNLDNVKISQVVGV